MQAFRRATIELPSDVRSAILLAAQTKAKQAGVSIQSNSFNACCIYLGIDLKSNEGNITNASSITIDKENLNKLNAVIIKYVVIKSEVFSYYEKDSKGQVLASTKDSKGYVVRNQQLSEIHTNSIPECFKTSSGSPINNPYLGPNSVSVNADELEDDSKGYIPNPNLAKAFEGWKQYVKYVKPEYALIQPLAFKPAPALIKVSSASHVNVYSSNSSSTSSSSSSSSSTSIPTLNLARFQQG